MMKDYLAHSTQNGYQAQSYADHVNGTTKKALNMAEEMAHYCEKDTGQIENILKLAVPYHDLGKLNEANQKVLHQKGEQNHHLPVNHVDAGAAFIKQRGVDHMYSLTLVYAHHQGLPDFTKEWNRSDETCFRDMKQTARSKTNEELENLLQLHRKLVPDKFFHASEVYEGNRSVFIRMVFSCLTDADHSDTAAVYGQAAQDVYKRQAMGPLTEEEKTHFTLVAISMLRMGHTKFLAGCSGVNLDLAAREVFWKRGLNFNHGTGQMCIRDSIKAIPGLKHM